MSSSASGESKRRLPVHAIRILILAAILLMLRLHQQKVELAASTTLPEIDLATVQTFLPEAHSLDPARNDTGGHSILNVEGIQLGIVMQTSPDADHIIGFSGPTNTLLIFNNDESLLHAEILNSQDTPNHVQAVLDDPEFLTSLMGKTKTELASAAVVDGVSGATLTSFAIRESITRRLGGIQNSLRFPKDPSLEDVKIIFPEAAAVQGTFVLNADGQLIGTLRRTSPAADNIIGYQGPTDTLIGLNPYGQRVFGIVPLQTYDNEEYVYYVRVDDYFRNILNGRTLEDLAALDLVEAEIEGVSGATMTSMAMARGVVQHAQVHQGNPVFHVGSHTIVFTSPADIASILIITLGIVLGLTRLRANARLRLAYSLVLIAYLGLYAGDMISLAMFAGWARHGIPWISAVVLILLSIAAVLLPIATGHNLYCHHLCPHGALQQIIRRFTRKRLHLSPKTIRILNPLRGILLTLCVILAITFPGFSLVQLEPFDAWVWHIAGWATITVAITGLAASFVIPMAYCRFGCPTGYLLDLLRRHRRSNQWSTADWTVTALLATAVISWMAV